MLFAGVIALRAISPAVADALGRPDRALLALARAVDLEQPDFLGVGEGEALAVVVVAVCLRQLVRDSDRLARRSRPFEDFDISRRAPPDAVR